MEMLKKEASNSLLLVQQGSHPDQEPMGIKERELSCELVSSWN